MTVLDSRVGAMVAGALTWTAAEYGLHRFAMHEMRGRGLPSVEHLRHHADVTYFSPASKKLASAVGTSVVVYPVMSAIAGRRWAGSFTAGMVTMYFGYEVAHRRTHTHAPTNRYGRWARRSHMHHHFGAPMRNFGVTSKVWDRILGTYDEPGVVTIPRRMAPVWLVDESGEVHPEFAQEYVVKGVPSTGDAEAAQRDRTMAFANLAPDA